MRRAAAFLAVATATLAAGCGPAPRAPHQTLPEIQQHAHRVFAGLFGDASAPTVGEVLTTTNGTWANTPTSFTYQWQDCSGSCSNIAAATASSYTIQSSDIGDTIQVIVTASNASGSASQTSSPTGTVTAATVSTAFSDGFSNSSVDTGPNQWTPTDNTIGNTNTFQCDRADHASESGGNLTISETSGSFTCLGPTGGTGGIASCPAGTCTTSVAGEEVTARDQAFKYGTAVVVAKLSGGASGNAWPAVWFLGDFCQKPQYLVAGNDPSPCNWPAVGSEEIDLEDLATQNLTHLRSGTITQASNPVCTSSTAISDMSANTHSYEMDWSSSSIVMKVDGTSLCTFSSNIPSSYEFMILTNQLNGTTVGAQPNDVIDSVAVTPAGPDISGGAGDTANWPAISGSLAHGSTLTANHGTWTGSPTGFAYQWMTCNSSGASCNWITSGSSCSATPFTCASTYATTAGEVGETIEVLVQATNASGGTQYGSQVTGAVT